MVADLPLPHHRQRRLLHQRTAKPHMARGPLESRVLAARHSACRAAMSLSTSRLAWLMHAATVVYASVRLTTTVKLKMNWHLRAPSQSAQYLKHTKK